MFRLISCEISMMENSSADVMEGIESTTTSIENPLMTARETTVLELYDRLEELQLEIALLRAQGVISQRKPTKPSTYLPHQNRISDLYPSSRALSNIPPTEPPAQAPEDITEQAIASAQQDILKAKATYQIRNNIINSVLIAHPVMRAVHAGRNASVLEQ